jgi:hypothetical protein
LERNCSSKFSVTLAFKRVSAQSPMLDWKKLFKTHRAFVPIEARPHGDEIFRDLALTEDEHDRDFF